MKTFFQGVTFLFFTGLEAAILFHLWRGFLTSKGIVETSGYIPVVTAILVMILYVALARFTWKIIQSVTSQQPEKQTPKGK